MDQTPTIDPTTNALALLGLAATSIDGTAPEARERAERGAAELARVFSEATARMRRNWAAFSADCAEIKAVMSLVDDTSLSGYGFEVRLHHDGRDLYDQRDGTAVDQVIRKMNVRVWEILVNKMGVKNLMSVRKREEFEKQLRDGDVPPVTEANIVGLVMGLADRAAEFATEAARETLKILTPSSGHYKTNSGFKVGRRVVLSGYVQQGWQPDTFRASHYREAEIIAIDATFHVLDEKGAIKERKTPLLAAIGAAVDGRAETDYFKVRFFKNGNMHIEFRRLDLVKKLNGLATGEYVLGRDDG